MSAKHIVIGAVVGAVAGFFIGDLLAAHFAPEYYTDEELEELLAQNTDILEENEYHLKQIRPVKTISDIREQKNVSKKDYTAHFVPGDGKEDLQKLVEKYNTDTLRDEVKEELAGDVDPVVAEWVEDQIETAYEDLYEPDDEEVLDNRDKDQIYIMTREEWDLAETGFTQVTLNYYPEDDVLVDSKNRPLRNVEKLIGEDALSNFGTFSDDEHVVYVCNPLKEAEYEILLQDGAYSDLVVGRPKGKAKTKAVRKSNIVVTNVFEEAAKADLEVEEGDETD